MGNIFSKRTIELALQRFALPHVEGISIDIFEHFAHGFLKHLNERFFASRDVELFFHQLSSLLRFISYRIDNEVKIRVFTPSIELHGYAIDRTIIEINIEDHPFIHNTAKMALQQLGLNVFENLYAVFDMHRTPGGKIETIGSSSQEKLQWQEIILHFEIERIDNTSFLEQIRQKITEKLQIAQIIINDAASMNERIKGVIEDTRRSISIYPDTFDNAEESSEFLEWLTLGHFVFMGYEYFIYNSIESEESIHSKDGEQKGISKKYDTASNSFEYFNRIRDWINSPSVLYIQKNDIESPVYRMGKLDVIIIKHFIEEKLKGLHLFVGLLSQKAIHEDGSSIPILRRKLSHLLRKEDFPIGSHYEKAFSTAFDSIPVEYLFNSTQDEIRLAIQLVLASEHRNESGVSVTVDPSKHYAFVLCTMPKQHYDDKLRERIGSLLLNSFSAIYVDHRLIIGTFDNAVMQFYLTSVQEFQNVNIQSLQANILQLIKPWHERFRFELKENLKTEESESIAHLYSEAFPENYTILTTPEEAVKDVFCIETLRNTKECQFRLSMESSHTSHSPLYKLKIYTIEPIHLTDSMPVLDHFGMKVMDQNVIEIVLGFEHIVINSFRITDLGANFGLDITARSEDLADGLRSVLTNNVDNDALNKLILLSGLTWRQVDVIRTYSAYLRQLEHLPLEVIRRVWLNHHKAARLFIDLFEVKFDPSLDFEPNREHRKFLFALNKEKSVNYLKSVENTAEDRVLRSMLKLVDATVRTNYFKIPTQNFISIKLDSSSLSQSTGDTSSLYEIFVQSHLVEAVHIRGGLISRGGIRWSDRFDDYRKEVLALMKTQMVKNVLIVPVGAKGGFVLKKEYASRDIEREQADYAYQIFIKGLLDLTDNIVDGFPVHPLGVVAYDSFDTYLVVAADKGTAHLSDIANSISREYGYWLGDAFASGGSFGYDHKKEGITARGSWECIKRHFRELGIEPEYESFTCVAIGDMSGDVFGNAMLLSKTIQLIAAFNHTHIFLDPSPDLNTSYEERLRLFNLPSSNWSDYKEEFISEGGGVYKRTAKAIPLSTQIKKMIEVDDFALSGEELIKHILAMKVDILWNCGIGTYVKSSLERNLDAEDRNNDFVRINAKDVRARIVSEGGNLGFTQYARIEYARYGGRINTDAIDNSGGVDLSDHEVNLKILFQHAIANSKISIQDRNVYLSQLKSDIVLRVLSHNYSQSLLISLDNIRSRENLALFSSVIETLEEKSSLNRIKESIPTNDKIIERIKRKEGLYRPELAKLAGHLKMLVKKWLLEDKRFSSPFLEKFLFSYFPSDLHEQFHESICNHILKREILTTVVLNNIIDYAGITFLQEMFEDTGYPISSTVMSYIIVSSILGSDKLKKEIVYSEKRIPISAQNSTLIDIEYSIKVHCKRLLRREYSVYEPEKIISALSTGFFELREKLKEILPIRAYNLYKDDIQHYTNMGIPEDIAKSVAELPYLVSLSDIALLKDYSSRDILEIAKMYHIVGESTSIRFAFDLTYAIVYTEDNFGWQKSAVSSLQGKLLDFQYKITKFILESSLEKESLQSTFEDICKKHEKELSRICLQKERIRPLSVVSSAHVAVLCELVSSFYTSINDSTDKLFF